MNEDDISIFERTYSFGKIVVLTDQIIVCRFCEKIIIECECRADIEMLNKDD